MTSTNVQAQDERAVQTGVVLIPLNKLKKSPRNARKTPHSKAEIEALAASIHAKGMLQNLVVEPELDQAGGRTGFYLLQIGEGRRRARAISRATMRNIRQNLFCAFAYNVACIPIAAGALSPITGDLLSPMVAAGLWRCRRFR